MRSEYEAEGKLDSLAFVGILSYGSATATTSFIEYGTPPLAYAVLEDSSATGVWNAYGASKDDMVLISQVDGAAPVIVERLQGADKIYPAYGSGKDGLKAIIDTYLP